MCTKCNHITRQRNLFVCSFFASLIEKNWENFSNFSLDKVCFFDFFNDKIVWKVWLTGSVGGFDDVIFGSYPRQSKIAIKNAIHHFPAINSRQSSNHCSQFAVPQGL